MIAGFVFGVAALKNVLFPSETEVEEPAVTEPSGPTEEELANPTTCSDDAVELKVKLPGDSLGAGESHAIPVEFHNLGEVPCLVDLGQEAVRAVITSGGDEVWSSAHCGAGIAKEQLFLLDVDDISHFTLTWPGTRSEQGCAEGQPFVDPGTYRLKISIDLDGQKVEEEQVFGVGS